MGRYVSRRHRGIARGRVIEAARGPNKSKPSELAAQNIALHPDLVAHAATPRPRTRGECAGGERPCPWVGCRYHLAYDINPQTGTLKENFPTLELEQLAETCALDVADQGGLTLDLVGRLINLTRERTRQIEQSACAKVEEHKRHIT